MNRIVLVTGGSRGIGAATAVAAAAQGYDVGLSYQRQRAAAEQVAARCIEVGAGRPGGVRAIAVPADVASPADVDRLFDTVDRELGPIWGLVNNAGTLGRQARVVDLEPGRVEQTLRVNVVGPFTCCRAAVARMSRSTGGAGGAIVNVSSRAAVLGSPGEYVDYAASKAALDALTVGLATEVAAAGIRVNSVRPGLIHTDLHALGGEPGRVERLAPGVPMGRGGEPSEVAAAIVWLLGDEASYVTGALLDVAGGR